MTATPIRPKPRDLGAALRSVGLEFTPRERRQMIAGLDGQIGMIQGLRDLALPNDAPTAMRFDPRLPGFRMPQGASGVTVPPVTRPLPESEADIAFAGLPDLSHWIATGQITSRRLTQIYLDRIARHAEGLWCFASVTAELALAQADARDALTAQGQSLGPLHGIPYAIKDLFDATGTVTGWGAEPFRDRVSDSDATVVRKLKEAGAVLLGKTSVGALAYGDLWYDGQCRNPWNPKEGSSGSSAGSASAAGAGLCAFAIGTETHGSIVSPSERCGTTGLRPTFGRVSRAGGMTLCWSLDKVGPIARGVADCAMVLAAINGADPADKDTISAPFGADPTAAPRPLRVGVRKGWQSEAHASGVARAIGLLPELGAEIVEIDLPDLPYDSLALIILAEAAAAFDQLTLSDLDDALRWQDAEAWPNLFRRSRLIPAVDMITADRLRARVMRDMDAVFDHVDLMIGAPDAGPMLMITNMTGHPSLHLRAGFSDEPARDIQDVPLDPADPARSRVPHGVSLWSGLFAEATLVEFGARLEAALGVAGERPDALAT